MVKPQTNANKNCLICNKEVDNLLFCDKCRELDVRIRITAFYKSKYWEVVSDYSNRKYDT